MEKGRNGTESFNCLECPLHSRKSSVVRHGLWCGPPMLSLTHRIKTMNLSDSLLMLEMDGRRFCHAFIWTMPWSIRKMLIICCWGVSLLRVIGKCCTGQSFTFCHSCLIRGMRVTIVGAYSCLLDLAMVFGSFSLLLRFILHIAFWEMEIWVSLVLEMDKWFESGIIISMIMIVKGSAIGW